MGPDIRTKPGQQNWRFLLLYALAVAGGAIAYVPLLTILLPVRVENMAGQASIDWLAYITFAGAIAASIASIGFGWLSDVTGSRRIWIGGGLLLSSAILASLSHADSFYSLIAMLIAWQLALNMMLGPLAAWAGDTVPDDQKGVLGGLLAFAPALGALVGLLITLPGFVSHDMRLYLVGMIVISCVAPVLLIGKPTAFPELTKPVANRVEAVSVARNGVVLRMWIARLLVQIAEAALFAYLYIWLRSLSSDFSDNQAAQIFFAVLLATVPIALWVGRWADKHKQPIFPLGMCAGISALALVAMAAAPNVNLALAAYAVFGVAAHVFLSLHSAQTLRVLPRPERRGRDLGIFNLTNTVPSPIMSVLTISLVPIFGFEGLFFLLAFLTALASQLLLSVRRMQNPGK